MDESLLIRYRRRLTVRRIISFAVFAVVGACSTRSAPQPMTDFEEMMGLVDYEGTRKVVGDDWILAPCKQVKGAVTEWWVLFGDSARLQANAFLRQQAPSNEYFARLREFNESNPAHSRWRVMSDTVLHALRTLDIRRQWPRECTRPSL